MLRKKHNQKGSIPINQTFLLVLAMLILMVLVGLALFMGGRAEEMIDSIKSFIPKPE